MIEGLLYWQMELRKRQLTNLFRHGEQVSWLGSGRRSLVSRPLSPNNMLDSPRYPSVVPLVNIALTFPRFLWKVLLKRKFPLQDPINCSLDVRTLGVRLQIESN